MQVFIDVKTKVDQLGSKPRYILITNFKDILAFDTKTEDTLSIPFKKLPQKFEFFLAWNGIEKVDFDKENPADIRAAERFAKLYDVIIKDNPDASRHGLNLFLIRLLFCLFAEDTNIFEKDLFTNRLKQLTKEDGSDLDQFVNQLFSILDVKKENRPADTPSYLNDFPYVDGDLFIEKHESLKFTEHSRKLIIDAGEKLEWDDINPDILGSMIQAVASEDSRSHLGMHYTSVPNIMKVIKPLFLDDLRNAFEDAKGNMEKLDKLYDRIGHIKFMDPACGSGNFLIITYKELRQLEIDIIKEQNNIAANFGKAFNNGKTIKKMFYGGKEVRKVYMEGKKVWDNKYSGQSVMYIPSVTLDQFYGIEIDDFACDVTRLSLWIAEHQMNVKLHEELQDAVRPTLPLQHAGDIVCGNALRLDWNEILPHKADDEVYLFGNPPYLGAYGSKQKKQHKEDMKIVFSNYGGNYKGLDYICCWFILGSHYINNTQAQLAFVSTSSITQGAQVFDLWYKIFRFDLEISFCWLPFIWSNNAKNNAKVTVNIIGLRKKSSLSKTIYKEKKQGYISSKVENINPYLTDFDNVFVKRSSKSIFGLPDMNMGDMANDGSGTKNKQGLLFSKEKYEELITKYPENKKFFLRHVGTKEYMLGTYRYCLWLNNKKEYKELDNISDFHNIFEYVKEHRLSSSDTGTNKLAERPYQFRDTFKAHEYSIVIPKVNTVGRLYIPAGLLDSSYIISDLMFAIYDGPLWVLGLILSNIHYVWIQAVCGREGNSYRYSKILGYNTFPVPTLSTRRKNEIEKLTFKIIDIRNELGTSPADLYGAPYAEKNPKPMNPRLLAAHQELDQVVDRAYKLSGFKDDNERLALLLDMYSKRMDELNE